MIKLNWSFDQYVVRNRPKFTRLQRLSVEKFVIEVELILDKMNAQIKERILKNE